MMKKRPNLGIAKAVPSTVASKIKSRTGGKRVPRGQVTLDSKGHMMTNIPKVAEQKPNIPYAS